MEHYIIPIICSKLHKQRNMERSLNGKLSVISVEKKEVGESLV